MSISAIADRLPTGEESLAQLEQCHGRALRGYLFRMAGGDFHRVEDIYQETLIRAWKHPEQRDARGRYGRQWLFTIARRICIDQYRAAARRPAEVPALDDLAGPADGLDRIERMLAARELKAALMTLGAEHRQIIYEMYFLDRPAREIAERRGIPVGTVKSRAYYAVRHLRNALAESGHSALAS